jgi:hypothetical protein
LGEAYYHLIPSRSRPDTLAKANFEAAIRADTAFTPPLYHLAQIAMRQGNVDSAAQIIGRFRRLSPGNRFLPTLELGLKCLRDGPETISWRAEVERDPKETYRAARMLSVGGANPQCAEAGLRALLAYGGERYEWAAFFGIHGLLALRGQDKQLMALVDSVISAGSLAAMTLYLIDAIAGLDVEEKATEVEEYGDRWGDQYERFRDFGAEYMWVAWLYGAWHSHRGDSSKVRSLRDILRERAEDAGAEDIALYAEALTGHLDLLRGDSAAAVERWLTLASVGIADSLNAEFGLSLPVERLRLAEVLCARGRYEQCLNAAAVFDHPGPLIFMPFLPASLVLRHRAAVRLRLDDLASELRTRLDRLGRIQLLSSR